MPTPWERCREIYAPYEEHKRECLAAWFGNGAIPHETRSRVWRKIAQKVSRGYLIDLCERIDRQRRT